MYSIDCFLGSSVQVKNEETGSLIEDIVFDKEPIFCSFQSISYKEFYQAQTSGFKPELILKISTFDYSKQSYVKYEDENYTILKTYVIQDNIDEMLLTLVKGIFNVNS